MTPPRFRATTPRPAIGFVARLADSALETSVVGGFSRVGYAVRSRLESWGDPPDAAGRTVVVTGATSGLGLAIAQRLAALGAHVHLVGRDERRLEDAVASVTRTARGAVRGHRSDLSSLADTASLATRLASLSSPIDVLIHNAGSLLARYTLTSEGVETTLATHLLSPYLLTEGLVASASFAPRARVIVMTSGGMYTERFDLSRLEMGPRDYRGSVAYARAKRAQTVLVAGWQRRLGPGGLAFHLVHPGWAATPGVARGLPVFFAAMRPLLRSPAQGADTAVWLSGLPAGEPEAGRLWMDRHPRTLHRLRRTRLDESEDRDAPEALATWCDARIERARGERD